VHNRPFLFEFTAENGIFSFVPEGSRTTVSPDMIRGALATPTELHCANTSNLAERGRFSATASEQQDPMRSHGAP
jgi:hypothetical protein